MSELAHAAGVPVSTGADVGGRAAAPAPSGHVRVARALARQKRALGALVAVCVAAIGIVIGYRALTRPVQVPISGVVAGTVGEEIVGPGTVQSRYSMSIRPRVAGTIDRVLVDVGDEVEKGQLLATLDRTELEARFRSARGAVASAKENASLTRANLAKARSDLDLARIRDQRARGLLVPGVISVAEADDTRGALRAAEASERAALAAVAAQEADRARLSQEQRVAETILAYTSLESPMAGVITRRALEPGSAAAPDVVVFQLVDANALWVATLVDQSVAGRIRVGQRAIIHLRSGAEASGHVTRIALEADPVTRELEIDVGFDERPSRFAINEEADVMILGERTQGLTIALEAVSHEAGAACVYVVEDGRARRRHVRLGIVGARRAQIVDGLSDGELVVLTPEAVRDGQRVVAAAEGG